MAADKFLLSAATNKRMLEAIAWVEKLRHEDLVPGSRPMPIPPFLAQITSRIALKTQARNGAGTTVANCWYYQFQEVNQTSDDNGQEIVQVPGSARTGWAVNLNEPSAVPVGVGAYVLVKYTACANQATNAHGENGCFAFDRVMPWITVTGCDDTAVTVNNVLFGPGFVVATSGTYAGSIVTNFTNDNYIDIYVDDCAVEFDWLGFDSQWYTSGSSLDTPHLTTDTPDPRGTVRLVFDQARSGSTITDNSISWDVSWSSANGGTLVVKGSVVPKIAFCDLTTVDCTTAVIYDRTIHDGLYAIRHSDGKLVPILANEVTVVTDVSWDDANHKIIQTKHTIYAPAMQVGSGSNSDVVVFDPDCPDS